MKPLISIIIPCYNHGLYIQEAIDSVEKSKGKYSVEIVIVDDGSTDFETKVILKKIEDNGYFVLYQENGGIGNARNNGIKVAKGKYILPLDSDNVIEKPYLNEAIEIMETNKNIDILYGNAFLFGDKSGEWIVDDFDLDKLKKGNYIDACAIYKKSVWKSLGGYDEKMPKMGFEDWDFWINCSLNKFNFYHLPSFCFSYRVLKNSMIRQLTNLDHLYIILYMNSKYNNLVKQEVIKKFQYEKINDESEFITNIISIKTIFIIIKNKIFFKYNILNFLK
jgi:glycosyltransferase involved in cell wall biosynthesis